MSTTKISDLPTENVSLERKEVAQDVQQKVDSVNEIKDLVNSLEENKAVTSLPNRDIPRNTVPITNDQEVKPNFVPQTQSEDYIKQYEEFIKSTTMQNKREKEETMNGLFEEIKYPILAACLFFLFQMPVIRKTMFSKLPMLFDVDGNPKLYYFLLNTLIFAGTFYGSQKLF